MSKPYPEEYASLIDDLINGGYEHPADQIGKAVNGLRSLLKIKELTGE